MKMWIISIFQCKFPDLGFVPSFFLVLNLLLFSFLIAFMFCFSMSLFILLPFPKTFPKIGVPIGSRWSEKREAPMLWITIDLPRSSFYSFIAAYQKIHDMVMNETSCLHHDDQTFPSLCTRRRRVVKETQDWTINHRITTKAKQQRILKAKETTPNSRRSTDISFVFLFFLYFCFSQNLYLPFTSSNCSGLFSYLNEF